MPYLRTPSGKYIEVPEGLSDDQAISLARKQFPQLYGIKPTVSGQIGEFVKGIPAGFVGSFGQAARGIGSLLPDEYEKPFASGVEKAVQALTPEAAAGYDDTVGRKLGEAMGSVGSFLIPGGAVGAGAKALGYGAAGIKAAQLGTAGALGSAAGAGEARTRAEAENATAEQRRTATLGGAAIGLSEIAPVERFLGGLGKEVVGGALGMIKRALVSGGVEAAQEAASNVAQNLLAREVYKPGQELLQGAGEGAAYGFGAGALTQVLLDAALGKRARTAAPPAPQDEEKIKQAQLAAEEQKQRQATVEAGYAPEGQGRLFGGEATPLPVAGNMQQLYKQMQEAEANGDTQRASQLRNDMQRLQSELQDPATEQPNKDLQLYEAIRVAEAKGDIREATRLREEQIQARGQVGGQNPLVQRRQQLIDARDALTDQVNALAGKDPDGIDALIKQDEALERELARVNALIKQAPPSQSREQAEKKLKALEKQLQKAMTEGDNKAVSRLTKQVVQLKNDLAQTGDLLAGVPELDMLTATDRTNIDFDERNPQAQVQQQPKQDTLFADEIMDQLDAAQQDKVRRYEEYKRQQEELADIDQVGGRAESFSRTQPLKAILFGRGIKVGNLDTMQERLDKLQKVIDSGKITGKVASLLGLPRASFDLSKPDQAAQALQVIETRLRELNQARITEFPDKELVKNGMLTEDGQRLMGVEATIGELKRLQLAAQNTVQKTGLSPAESGLLGVLEATTGKGEVSAEQQEKKKAAALKRASDINKFTEQRSDQMFNWGNEIDSLRKGDNVADVSRRAAELRVEQIALLAKMEAAKRVEQTGVQMSIPAQEQLENAVQQWLGRITKNAKPGEPEGALQNELRDKLGVKQGAIDRGMTITDTKTGELARLQQGVDRLILRAVEKYKREKPKKQKGPFGLTQQSAAVLSSRYDTANADTQRRKEDFSEPDLSGRQKDMFAGSEAETYKKKRAVEKRTATVESKKQAKLEETKALLQKIATEKEKKKRRLERRALMADTRQKLRAEQKEVSKRNATERLASLVTLKDKLENEIAKTKADAEAERLAPLAESVLANIEYADGLEPEQRDRLTRQILEESQKSKIKLKSFDSLSKLTSVQLSGETKQYLRGLDAQLNAVNALITKTQAEVATADKREKATAALQEKQKPQRFVPAGQVVTPEDSRPPAKQETAEDKATRLAREEMRNRVETQFEIVADTQAAIAVEEERIEAQIKGEWREYDTTKGIYREDPLDASLLSNMEYAAGLTPKQRAKITKQVNEAALEYRQNTAESIIRTEAYKRRLIRNNKALTALKKDLKVFEDKLTELTKQEDALRREAQLKPLKAEAEGYAKRLANLIKNSAQRDADVNKEARKQTRDAGQVLADIAQGKIKGQRGVRTEQVPAAPNPKLEGQLEALYAQIGKLGNSVKDQQERVALMRKVDALVAGTYKNVPKPFAEKAPAASDAGLADLEAAQAKQSGVLKIEQREDQPVGRVKPAREIKRVRDRYLAMRAAGKERQAQAFREKHIDLFLGPLEGLVRGVESREGKRTPAPLKTGLPGYTPEFTTDRDTVDQAGLGQQRRAADDGVDWRDATDADTGVDLAEAQAIADRVKAALPEGVDFIYAPTLADAPAAFQEAVAASGRKAAKGAVMPDGRVVVIGEAHSSPKDVEESIAHELIGHYGADMVLGPEGMKSMVADMTKKGLDHVAEVATGLGVFPDVATARMAMPKNVDEKVMTVLVREMIAHAAEGRRVAPRFAEKVKTFIRDLISKVRGFFRNAGLSSLAKADTKAIQKILNDAERALSRGRLGIYKSPDGQIVFRSVTSKPEGMSDDAWELTNALVGSDGKRWQDQTKAKLLGIAATTAFDSKAPVKMAAEIGVKKGLISDMEAVQNIYTLSQHGKVTNHTLDTVQNGPRELVYKEQDGEKYWQVTRKEGKDVPTLLKVFASLDKSGFTPEQYDSLFTLFLASKRIKNEGVGIAKLSYRKDKNGNLLVTEEKLTKFEKEIASNKKVSDAFEEARRIYNAYNEGLINFAVQAGALSKELAAVLKAKKDFIPFYREKDGEFELVFDDGSTPISIGNIKDQPYLHELVGGDQRILPIFQSAVQNTRMLTDMALRNLATKDTAMLLSKLGMTETYTSKKKPDQKNTIFKGMGSAGPNILRFKLDGEDVYIKVKTEGTIFEEIPAELLVKGMEGIKTTFPPTLRLLGLPAKLLRHFIVLSPTYPIRSLIRESLSAWGTSGADFTPILDPIKNLAKAVSGKSETVEKLQREGLGGGQLLSGISGNEEMAKILRAISSGKTTWNTALAWLESTSMLSDTAIRATAYDSFIKQKLNPVRAWVATNEIMDYNRKGTSPMLHIANTMYPFFATQLQGLSIMYRAMSGRMPMNDRLKIQDKFIRRGLTLGAMTLAYAAMMQDDEAYQNASPEARLANWFVRIPGFDEPLKIPIPFEYGLLFKAIPEAIYHAAFSKEDFAPVGKALAKMAANSIPGMGSYFMPQIAKPIISQATGVDLFTGADIETPAMQKLDPAARYKDNTTELAKMLGAGANISPARIDQFIKDIGSGTLLSLVSLANPLLAGDNPPSASMKTSKYPLVGGMFQPTDAGAVIDRVYEKMEEATQAKNTYEKLLAEGREDKAEAYLNANIDRIMLADSEPSFKDAMKQLTDYEKAIRADREMSPAEKREALDEIRRQKIDTAKQYRDALREAA